MSRGYSETVADTIKIYYDTTTGTVSSVSFEEERVTNASIDPLAIYSQPYMPTIGYQPASKAYVDQEIWSAIAWVYTYKGSVATASDLDNIQNPQVWDVYNVQDTGMNYAWNGTSWDALGSDLTNIRVFDLPGTDDPVDDTPALQWAIDWWKEWKYPVIKLYWTYYFFNSASGDDEWDVGQNYLTLQTDSLFRSVQTNGTRLVKYLLYVPFYKDTQTSTGMWVQQWQQITQNFLEQSTSYQSIYTPQYDNSPANKYYVDNAIPNGGYGIEKVTEVIKDTQWPCPDGFHIPTPNEVNYVRTIINNMVGVSGDNVSEYLKLPYTGQIQYNNSTKQMEWDAWGIWSCGANGNDTAYVLWFESDYLGLLGDPKASWLPIRPFANEFVQPDSSWTTLYDGSSVFGTNAWIFWSPSLGLISIRLGDNYSTIYRLTMSDKNLGATQVYNYGDTLSAANCGNYYQWWNNYGFSYSWPASSTTTQVDASAYWPGNYYSSSDFIYGNQNWSTVVNSNLWGWATDQTIYNTVYNNILPFEPQNQWSTGQVLTKTADGYNWQNGWWGWGGSGNTETFFLSSTADLTNAQAAVDYYLAGNNPLINLNGRVNILNAHYVDGSNEVLQFYPAMLGNTGTHLITYFVTISYDPSTNIANGVNEYFVQVPYVSSVNGGIWWVNIEEFSPGNSGTTGQVLKKTASGYEWANESWWGGWSSYSAGNWIDITNSVISNTMYPSNQSSGSVWNILAKTANGTAWLDATTLTNVKAWNVTSATSSTLEAIVNRVNTGSSYSAILKLDATPDVFVYGNSSTVGWVTTYYFPSLENNKNATSGWWPATGYTTIYNSAYTITVSNGTYTWAYVPQWQNLANVIEPTGVPYQGYFTPTADYHPATKKYVDDAVAGWWGWWWGNVSSATINNIWTGTQAQYDAITTKDTSTLYFVIES